MFCALVFLSCASPNTKAQAKETRVQTLTKTLHVSPLKKGDSHYAYVPFEVSAETRCIRISYAYDRANGSNAIDIGLFDSRSGSKAGNLRGFRGWSGGRRTEFFVSQNNATPGYIPGEIRAGTWQIVLGLYRVAASGVDVTFKIEISQHDTKVNDSTARLQLSSDNRANQRRLEKRWVIGDLHMHTVHSDGDWTVAELVSAARNSGLDFICITDHNTSSHHADINEVRATPGLLVMRGEEVTSYGGHANVWGLKLNSVIDWRIEPEDQLAMRRTALAAHRHGALISINHPFAPCAGCNWTYPQAANYFDAIEVWNASWDAMDGLALSMWDGLLKQGRHITAIGSSDSHRHDNPIGSAATHVQIQGPLSDRSILNAIKAGHAYVTIDPLSPRISFEAQSRNQRRRIGETLVLNKPSTVRFTFAVTQQSTPATVSWIVGGTIVNSFQINDQRSFNFEFEFTANTYCRVEVRSTDGKMLALTNPIYVEIRNSQPAKIQ
jgi:hypothetical protein